MKVLVVDDSTLFRKVVRDVLAKIPSVEVVGVAPDGRNALEKIKALSPDLITLDVEMPIMDGISVLRALEGMPSRPEVIMLSASTGEGAVATTQALRLGAFDFVLKPAASSYGENCKQLMDDFLPKVRALQNRQDAHTINQLRPKQRSAQTRTLPPGNTGRLAFSGQPAILAIGISTGGPAALGKLLPCFAADFPVPIAIVQHMPPVFTQTLAKDLDSICKIRVQEARHGQSLEKGNAYFAPGGKQLRVGRIANRNLLQVTNDPAEKNCRPSVDYLFRSVASQFGSRALGVIMTGMGDDGTEGCRELKQQGGQVITQDEASCVVYGMPKRVAESGLSDRVCSLDRLGQEINQLVGIGATVCR